MKGERAVKDLDELSPLELLRLHARVAAALRDRGVTRTANNPTGDYGELLFCIGASPIAGQVPGRPSRPFERVSKVVGSDA